MEGFTVVEKALILLIAAGGVVAGWTSKMGKLSARIDATEKDIKGLKEAHDEKLSDIKSSISALDARMQRDVQALWERTEDRHNKILGKLDDIARGLK